MKFIGCVMVIKCLAVHIIFSVLQINYSQDADRLPLFCVRAYVYECM